MTQRFTGKERDAETGLDYFGARYFSGVMGRWTSPDWSEKPESVPYADFSDPQTLNLYAYVRNNPPRLTDPDGHGFWTKFGNWFTGGGWNEDEEAERVRQATAQRQADEARAALSQMHGFTINGQTPAEIAKSGNNQQVMDAYGQAQNFLLGVAQDSLSELMCPKGAPCGVIPIGPLKGPIPNVRPTTLAQQLTLKEAAAAGAAGTAKVAMTELADAPRLVANYGPGKWVKMEWTHRAANGTKQTVHWFQNQSTGQQVEFKFK